MFNPQYCGCGEIPFGPQYPRIAPSGWNFGQFPCDPCANPGPCPIQLDFNCIIYHKDNSQVNNLGPIGLNNGATLQLFADTVAAMLGPLAGPGQGPSAWSLPCLRAVPYTINTFQQFGQAIDTQLCILQGEINAVIATASTPITPVDTHSINLTVSGTLNHTLQADVIISPNANNLLSIQTNGLFSAPQDLSINTATKVLSISNGNSVDLTSIVCAVGGFLGNLTTDPSTPILDGQYWWNTTSSLLKIQVNGIVKTITTT
jgi:hypothetical protein